MNTDNTNCIVYKLSENGEIDKTSLNGEVLSCVLGRLDGVHIGHQRLISCAVNNQFGYTPAVWTFSKPLSEQFIENVPERLSLCGRYGIDIAVCEDFGSVKDMSPEQFVLHLYEHFGVRHFICGYDFRFGLNRAGDTDMLKVLASKLGAAVTVVPTVTIDELFEGKEFECEGCSEKVSSTVLRRVISEGKVERAEVMLGRRFGVTANVCDGKQIGRTMGLPTINQKIELGRVIPAFGVYYSVAIYDGEEHFAVTNVGVRPTVNKVDDGVTCETHILDVNADLYGKIVRVELCRYVRAEKRFSGIEQLKNAIVGDICGAKMFFGIDCSK